MNILMLFSTDIPICDGIASHVVELSERLRERGHNIVLMTRGGWHGESFEYRGFKVIKAPFFPLYPFHVHFHGLFVRKAIATLDIQPDIIHLHTPLVSPLSIKKTIVTTFHTPMIADTAQIENIGLKTALIKLMGKTTSYWFEKKLLSISDAIITVSYGVADELRTLYGYKNHLYPILNAVDSDIYKPADDYKGEKTLLYMGRLSYRKGLIDIVNSAKHVIKKHPDVIYKIVGSGPLESTIKKLIKKNELGNKFRFYGEIRDRKKVLQYYQDAYAVLVPSHYEGLPMTLLEAMSCGKPIISTSASFNKGVLENGINALLVEPKSPEDLGNATNQLLSSEELCLKIGKAARKTIVGKMSAEINTNKVIEVYNHALEHFNKERSA